MIHMSQTDNCARMTTGQGLYSTGSCESNLQLQTVYTGLTLAMASHRSGSKTSRVVLETVVYTRST